MRIHSLSRYKNEFIVRPDLGVLISNNCHAFDPSIAVLGLAPWEFLEGVGVEDFEWVVSARRKDIL